MSKSTTFPPLLATATNVLLNGLQATATMSPEQASLIGITFTGPDGLVVSYTKTCFPIAKSSLVRECEWNAHVVICPADGSPRRTVWDPNDKLCTCAADGDTDARSVESFDNDNAAIGVLWDANVCVIFPTPDPHSRTWILFDWLKISVWPLSLAVSEVIISVLEYISPICEPKDEYWRMESGKATKSVLLSCDQTLVVGGEGNVWVDNIDGGEPFKTAGSTRLRAFVVDMASIAKWGERRFQNGKFEQRVKITCTCIWIPPPFLKF